MPYCMAASLDHHQSDTKAFPAHRNQHPQFETACGKQAVAINIQTLPGSPTEYPSGNRFSAKDGSRSTAGVCFHKRFQNVRKLGRQRRITTGNSIVVSPDSAGIVSFLSVNSDRAAVPASSRETAAYTIQRGEKQLNHSLV